MNPYYEYEEWSDIEFFKHEQRATRSYQNKLAMFPHCGDPNHPGCQACAIDEYYPDGEYEAL